MPSLNLDNVPFDHELTKTTSEGLMKPSRPGNNISKSIPSTPFQVFNQKKSKCSTPVPKNIEKVPNIQYDDFIMSI